MFHLSASILEIIKHVLQGVLYLHKCSLYRICCFWLRNRYVSFPAKKKSHSRAEPLDITHRDLCRDEQTSSIRECGTFFLLAVQHIGRFLACWVMCYFSVLSVHLALFIQGAVVGQIQSLGHCSKNKYTITLPLNSVRQDSDFCSASYFLFFNIKKSFLFPTFCKQLPTYKL